MTPLGIYFGEQKYVVPLNESQPELVRGTLEDPRNTPEEYPGWRWLQCTDYPGQFRILIPPKIASIYARLLDAEKWELGTYLLREDGRRDIVWERVAILRALKNKMLRRCMRMVDFRPYDPEISFRLLQLHAPPTFTITSLEKWAKTVPIFTTGNDSDRGGSGSRTHPTSRSSNDRSKRQQSSESECNDNSNSGDGDNNSGDILTEGGRAIILFEQFGTLSSCHHTSF